MRSRAPALRAASFLLLLLPILPARGEADPAPDLPVLTLEEAVARALARNPALRGTALALDAAGARLDQARRYPNPSLEVEAENFAGTGPFRGTGAAEWTVGIAQPVPLGGKRRAARRLAEADRELAALDREERRLRVIARVRAAFWRTRIARERVALGEETLALAERLASVVRLRVDAGRAAPVDAIRAGIEVSRARTRLARARREHAAARAALASAWGASAPDFSRVEAPLPAPEPPPPWAALLERFENTPAIRRLAVVRARAGAVVARERARAVPDLELRAARRRFAESGDGAWVAAVALPLPLLDANRGNRKAALLDAARARLAEEGTRADLAAALRASRERLAAAARELASLRDEVVPAAEEALSLVTTGYREGKFGFLEVLDAQRDLVGARELLLAATEEYLLARTDLAFRAGGELPPAPGETR